MEPLSFSHAAHTVIALWALGANEEILNAAYRYASSYLLPAFDSPSSIDEGNWKTHLGDEKSVCQTVFVLASGTLLIDISLDIIRLTSHSSLKRSRRKAPMPS